MKKIIVLSLLSVCGLLFSSSAFSETRSLLKAPSSVSGQSYQLAGIYWLPDYLKDNVDNNKRSEISPDHPDFKGECGTYGLIASCAAPKEARGPKRPRQDLTCYERCLCPSNYRHTSSNCSSAGFTLGGGSCDGKYKSCDPKDCPDGSDTSCSSGQIATFNGSYSGNSKCYTCRDRTCAEGGAACASGSKCVGSGASARCLNDTCSGSSQKQACDTVNYTQSSAGNTEAGTACYNCTPKACPTSLSCDYDCKTYDTSRLAMCGRVCVECESCKPNDCSAYPLTTKPANASYDPCTPGCGDGVARYKINACNTGYKLKNGACVSDTCSPGYSKTACNSNQEPTGTKYTEAGTACYACRAKTCADGNLLDACPSGQVGTAQSFAGLTCYNNCKVQNLTCEEWVRATYPDFSINTGSSYLSGSDVLVTGNIDATYTMNVSGKVVGPKYFSYDKCQAMTTPTISVTYIDGSGINLKGGTLANLNVEYDPVSYNELGPTASICAYYSFCNTNMGDSSLAQNLYNSAKSDYNFCNNYPNICQALRHQDCVSNSGYLESCSTDGYSCRCTYAAESICHDEEIRQLCKNNKESAIIGYGTLKDVVINAKNRDMSDIVYPTGGTMTIEGTVKITGPDRATPLRIGSNAISPEYPTRSAAKLVVNGTLDIKCGRDIYVSSNGEIVVNTNGTIKISYGSWGGFFFNSANKPMIVYGTLDITSHGSGGRFNNDLQFHGSGKEYVQLKNGSCTKMAHGAGGSASGGGSGIMRFESGAQLKLRGTCRKAGSSGSVTITNQSRPNELYGAFTSLPSQFNGSCNSCY